MLCSISLRPLIDLERVCVLKALLLQNHRLVNELLKARKDEHVFSILFLCMCIYALCETLSFSFSTISPSFLVSTVLVHFAVRVCVCFFIITVGLLEVLLECQNTYSSPFRHSRKPFSCCLIPAILHHRVPLRGFQAIAISTRKAISISTDIRVLFDSPHHLRKQKTVYICLFL